MRLSFMLLAIVSLIPLFDAAAARSTLKPPTPKVTIKYVGTGFASFLETYTQPGNSCSVQTTTAREDVSSVNWNITWKDLTPSVGANIKARKTSFSAFNSRTDSQDCGGASFSCTSKIGSYPGVPPTVTVSKSGKGFILTILAEQQTKSSENTSSTCLQSSVFDNAITEGMNGKYVTALKIKLQPSDQVKTKTLPFSLNKAYDCVDPAKQMSFLSTACEVETSFTGTVKVTGQWKASLVK